jgi:hypothetical protein
MLTSWMLRWVGVVVGVVWKKVSISPEILFCRSVRPNALAAV